MKQPLSQALAAQHQCLDLGLQGLGLLRYAMELLVAVPATGCHRASRNKVRNKETMVTSMDQVWNICGKHDAHYYIHSIYIYEYMWYM